MTDPGTHLVIGGSGLVGGALLQAASRSGVRALGTSFGHPQPGAGELILLAVVTTLGLAGSYLGAGLRRVIS